MDSRGAFGVGATPGATRYLVSLLLSTVPRESRRAAKRLACAIRQAGKPDLQTIDDDGVG